MESFVSISSPNMLAMRTTISSTPHNSYARGKTFGGPLFGLDRLGELGWLAATTEEEGWAVARSWDLRRLPGDRGFVRGSSGFSGEILGSGGGSGTAEGGAEGITVADAVVVMFAGRGFLGQASDGWTDRRGTVGSNGSIGEYWVATSTPTYCFGGLGWDKGEDRASKAVDGPVDGAEVVIECCGGEGCGKEEEDCLDWRRASGATTLGDFGPDFGDLGSGEWTE